MEYVIQEQVKQEDILPTIKIFLDQRLTLEKDINDFSL